MFYVPNESHLRLSSTIALDKHARVTQGGNACKLILSTAAFARREEAAGRPLVDPEFERSIERTFE